jgi:cytochrome c oxidase subunit 2
MILTRETCFVLVFVLCLSVVPSALAKVDQSLCVACHGGQGQGNKFLKAPGLANLDDWYIERQLKYFRDGQRGIHPNDQSGAQMLGIVQSLSDEIIQEYAKVISAYPDRVPNATLDGDAVKGKAYYSHQCGACHGASGKGIKSMGAPRLAGLEDWYLEKQIENFQTGVRGAEKGDRYGSQMVFYMKKLKSTEDLNDIIAYLRDPESVD